MKTLGHGNLPQIVNFVHQPTRLRRRKSLIRALSDSMKPYWDPGSNAYNVLLPTTHK